MALAPPLFRLSMTGKLALGGVILSAVWMPFLLIGAIIGRALPDDGQIAFVSGTNRDDQIYLIDVRQRFVHKLTNKPVDYFNPMFSPDGSRIVFTAANNRGSQIYVMDLRGHSRNLSQARFGDTSPSWSPDGKRLAFVSTGQNGAASIWVMNADGSDAQALNNLRVNHLQVPGWSPDGQQIAFVADGVFIADVTTGRIVAHVTPGTSHGSPMWSPDGQYIAFGAVVNGEPELYMVNADGSHLHRVVRAKINYSALAWSADSQSIAYVAYEGANTDIFVTNVVTGDLRRLTRDNHFDWLPAWSPDGRQIAFISYRKMLAELYVMDADGLNVRRLTYHGIQDLEPIWMPRR
jgi:TolB protein